MQSTFLPANVASAASVNPLAYAYGGPKLSGKLKASPEDFCVTEQLGFTPSGEGEHIFLDIEKRCLTTLAVRDSIARLAGCKTMDVGYGGLKDKWACTRQWFSIYLPGGGDIDWTQLQQHAASKSDTNTQAQLLIHAVTKHNRKLRRGAHKANAFQLRLSGLASDSIIGASALAEYCSDRLQQLADTGMPNYFGEQRFGANKRANNLAKARALFVNNQRMPREQRSLCLSAARSYLFNCVLSARVASNSWTSYIDGDVLMLEGSRSQFSLTHNVDRKIEPDDAERKSVVERLQSGDIHISGPLCGRGEGVSKAAAQIVEQRVLAPEQALVEGLCRQGVDQDRRSLRALPKELDWHLESDKLQLSFVLPTGSYATMLVRELVNCD